MTRVGPVVLVAFGTMTAIAGVNFTAVRFSNDILAPFWGATLRFGAAAVLFLALATVLRIPLPRGRALVGSVLFGSIGIGAGYAFAYYALTGIGPGLASVVMAATPLLTLLLAAAHGAERLTWRGVAGGALALAGIGVMFVSRLSSGAAPLAALAMLGAAVAAAEAPVLVKRFPRVHPVAANVVGMATAALILAIVSVVAGEPKGLPATPGGWAVVGYLAVIGSVGLFGLYLFVLGRWTASASSYMMVLAPLVAVPLGAAATGEPLGAAFLAGGAVVLAGVWLGALSGPSAAATAKPAAASDTR